ncbi:MAG: hypothetical protein KA004_17260 [Verrucomicrobiales bacterium]|nr:hypothetical protein [Verrucomicrobiales bacterium]
MKHRSAAAAGFVVRMLLWWSTGAVADAQSAFALPELRRAGDVSGVVAMPDGGAILSGTFTRVGNVVRRGLVRLTATGTVVPDWRADFNNGVQLMQKDGPWLYVAGSLSTLNEQYIAPKFGLISGPLTILRLDAETGALDTSWYYLHDNTFNYFLVDSGRLVVATRLTNQVLIRTLDLPTLQPVAPNFFNFGTEVRMLKRLGSHIYAAGSFSFTVNGSTKHGVARFAASSMTHDTDWSVSTLGTGGFSYPIYDVDADQEHVYLGGGFSNLNGLPMNGLARVTLDNAALDSAWRPNVRGVVVKVALWNGFLYADGPLDQVGSTPHIGLFRVSVTAGAGAFDSSWDLRLENSVSCFAATANRLYLGGYLATDSAMGVLSLNSTGGVLGDFLPQVSDTATVKTSVADGSGVIIGGDFTHVGGQRAVAVARFTNAGVLDTSWDAGIRGWEIFVEKLTRDAGGALFLAGEFLQVKGARRSNLARLNPNGTLDATWAPNPTGTVNTATVLDTHLYIGGSFQNLDNSPNRFYGIARLNLTNGAADDGWIPVISYSPSNRIHVVEPDGPDHVLVGGFFNVVFPSFTHLARIHRTTAALTAAGNPDGEVRTAAWWNGNLWLGGNFNTMNGTLTPPLGQYSGTGWVAAPVTPLGAVYSLTVAGTKLVVAGDFRGVISGGVTRPVAWLMRLTPSGLDQDWWPVPDAAVQSVVTDSSGAIWASGGFTRLGSVASSNSVKLTESAVLPEVIGWGAAWNPLVIPPTTLRGVKFLSRGLAHGLAVLEDGSISCWGQNSSGQATPPPGMPAAVAVAGGAGHSVALHENGTLTVWGDLEDGVFDVPPGLDNVVQVASGLEFMAALRKDGTVLCWGGNARRELDVPPALSDVIRISCGAYHTLALKADGTVVSWGVPTSGALFTPGNLPRITDISAGISGCGALSETGDVQVWGANLDGQLSVPEDLPPVETIHGMTNGFLARLPDGTLRGWGRNNENQLIPPGFLDSAGAAHVAGFGNAVAVLVNDTREPRRPRWITPRFVLAGQNQAFRLNLPVGGVPTSVSASGLPAGVTVSGNPPILAGTGAVPGDYAVSLTASNASGTKVQPLRLTILPPTPPAPSFAAWATARGLTGENALPLADPDADGRANLLEYATDGNPLATDAPAADLTLNPAEYEWTFHRAMRRPDIDLHVQYSSTGQSWITIASSMAGTRLAATVPGWITYEEVHTTTHFVAAIGQTGGVPPRGFFRLRVVLNN